MYAIHETRYKFYLIGQTCSKYCIITRAGNKYQLVLFQDALAPTGPGPPQYRGFTITHNDAPQSVGFLWMRDQPNARPIIQHNNTHMRQTSMPPTGFKQQASGRRPTP
jgi:hypothetical protein